MLARLYASAALLDAQVDLLHLGPDPLRLGALGVDGGIGAGCGDADDERRGESRKDEQRDPGPSRSRTVHGVCSTVDRQAGGGVTRHEHETVPASPEACNREPTENICKEALFRCLSRGSVVRFRPLQRLFRGLMPLAAALAAGAFLAGLLPAAGTAETAPDLRARAAELRQGQTALQRTEHGALLLLYAAEASLAERGPSRRASRHGLDALARQEASLRVARRSVRGR